MNQLPNAKPSQSAAVAAYMARIVDGDTDAIFEFYDDFGHKVRFLVKKSLLSMGRHDLLRDVAEFEGIVLNAWLDMTERASGWSPEGALPWTWAGQRIYATVVRGAGHAVADPERFASLEGDNEDGNDLWDINPSNRDCSEQVFGRRPASVDSFVDVAIGHPGVQKFIDALSQVASPKNTQVFLDYRYQQCNGDISPSHTVADWHEMTPDNVRQIFSRTLRKFRSLIEDDESLAPFREIEWI
ncbi:MAG: hypothetical protein ABGX61_04470 [Acidimicrobiales bacterium]|nr:hypothetical protein [Acidimicrobiia bacterium]